jgi:hypothetical protein
MFKYIFIFSCCFTSKTLLADESKDNLKEIFVIKTFKKGSGKPLKRVEAKQGSKSFYSNKKGEINIPIIDINFAVPIVLYKAGYDSQEIDLSKQKDAKQIEVYFVLSRPDDRTIVIFGKKKKQVSKKEISIREASEVAPRGDPVQVTKLLPGVQTTNIFGNQIVVRGSAPNDSKYLVNNLDVPFIYHGVGGFSVVPRELLSEVQFYAGGFPVEYGEATGGVVSVQTKDKINKERKTYFSVNLPLYSSIYHDEPIDNNSSISLSFRRSYVDFFIKKLLSEAPVSVLPVFYDAHIQYLRKISSGYQKFIFINSMDGLELSVPSVGATSDGKLKFDINTNFSVLGFEQKGRLSKGWSYNVSPHIRYTVVKNKIQDSDIDIKGWIYRLPINFNKKLSKQESLKLGLEVVWNDVDVYVFAPRFVSDDPFRDFEEPTLVESKSTYQEWLLSQWGSWDYKIGDFILTPGLRWFYSTQIYKWGYDPRFISLWKYKENEQFKFALGQYSKSPSPQDTDEEFGNTELTYEKSLHYILGWEKDWGDIWTTDFQVYYKKDRDVIRSDKFERYKNSGEKRSYGFEAFLRRNQTERSFGWLSYTYSNTQEKKTSESSWVPYRYDQAHVVNLVGSYKLSGQLSLGGRINYHTGDRYTPVASAVYNANLGKYQRKYEDSQINSERLPDYYQIDLYSIYDFLFNTWTLKIRGGIEYLAFTRPAFAVDYNYDYSKNEFLKSSYPVPYIEIQGVL